jgi:hypothetical protein
MAGPFDGLARILTASLGDAVTIYPGGGPGVSRRGILRREPVEIAEEFGGPGVLSVAAYLKLPLSDATGLAPGDRVEGGARAYRVANRVPSSGNPEADALQTFELEEVTE